MTADLDILGTQELATELGIKPRTLSGYLNRGFVPEPAVRLACGPVWTREQVQPLLERQAKRLAKLDREAKNAERNYARCVAQTFEGIDPGLTFRRSEQARRNTRSKVKRVRDERGTVKEQLLREAEQAFLAELDARAGHPVVDEFLAEQERAAKIRRDQTRRAELRVGFSLA